MKRLTYKVIESQVAHVNEYVLENSIYKLHINKAYGYYHIYLMLKQEPHKTTRLMYVGNAAETNAYLIALQNKYWYMKEPF